MRRFLLASCLLLTAICGACDEDGGGGDSATLEFGAFCDPSFPRDCPGAECHDAVGGESCDTSSCTDWGQASNQGTICTRTCSGDEDCAGLDFAATNEERVSSEDWFCAAGICRVVVTAPPGESGDICTGCGGVFCAGPCIGCPQC